MWRWMLVAGLVAMVGCSKESAKEAGEGTVDVITQRNKVKAGQEAANKLKGIGAQRNDDLNEASGE